MHVLPYNIRVPTIPLVDQRRQEIRLLPRPVETTDTGGFPQYKASDNSAKPVPLAFHFPCSLSNGQDVRRQFVQESEIGGAALGHRVAEPHRSVHPPAAEPDTTHMHTYVRM